MSNPIRHFKGHHTPTLSTIMNDSVMTQRLAALSRGFREQAFWNFHVARLLLHLFNSEIIAQSNHTQHLHQLVWLYSSNALTKAGGMLGAGSWQPTFIEQGGMLQLQTEKEFTNKM